MGVEFRIDEQNRAILIIASGAVSAEDLRYIRTRTVELLNETGIQNYLVDMVAVISVFEQDTTAAYNLGKNFSELDFPLSTKTAVILPENEEACQQAKFLHTVEVNRMRGPLKYVTSYAEALDWFNT